uniref:Nad4L n=1 Tax=Stylonychia lemnae TaxID=5949 RepID=A0A3S6K756_STYLE|nr:Nad4L [Stylonychia lemnae]
MFFFKLKNTMMVESLNLFFLFFLLIFFSIFLNSSTSLHLLLTAEILWITLYAIVSLIGMTHDNLNILSLTFFFLVLSAVEFGIGLVILLIQNIFTRSLSLNENDSNFFKFSSRFKSKLFLNKVNWKI